MASERVVSREGGVSQECLASENAASGCGVGQELSGRNVASGNVASE